MRSYISIVQMLVRLDQMMAGVRTLKSYDASLAYLSPTDRSWFLWLSSAGDPCSARWLGDHEHSECECRRGHHG